MMRRVIITLLGVVTFAFGQGVKPPVDQLSQLTDVQITGPINGQVLTYDSGTLKWKNAAGGAAAGVTSWNTRTGAVVPVSGDYSIGQITGANATNWDTAYTDRLKWDGGATGLVAATGRISLGLVIGTNVQAWDADLDALGGIAGNSKFAFRNSSGIWQARGLGTNLTDDGTNINAAGGGGGTPGGANTNIQYNDSSVFGGDANLTWDKTGKVLSLGGNVEVATDNQFSRNYFYVRAKTAGNGIVSDYRPNTDGLIAPYAFQFVTDKTTIRSLLVIGGTTTSGTKHIVGVDGTFGQLWDLVLRNGGSGVGFDGAPDALTIKPGAPICLTLTSTGVVTLGSGADTGLYRNSAGVVEINNGTAGQFRDVKLRTVIHNGYTVATLPTGVAGMVAYITDGAASLAWGATATGGSTTKYLVWYNGTNWTVVGK